MLQILGGSRIKFLCFLVFMLAGLTRHSYAETSSNEAGAGLQPGNVYAVWININKVILATASNFSDDPLLLTEIEAMQPATYSGKEPQHVLERIRKFSGEVNRMREHAGFPSIRLPEDREKILPSLVFLSSGRVLAGLLGHYVCLPDVNVMVSDYFRNENFYTKTPNEVFGLVDLATRRFNIIMATPPVRHGMNPDCATS